MGDVIKRDGLHIYLPNGYWESNERYPVVYFFDGQNLFYDSDATFGHSLGLKGFLDGWWKKLIVVGIPMVWLFGPSRFMLPSMGIVLAVLFAVRPLLEGKGTSS